MDNLNPDFHDAPLERRFDVDWLRTIAIGLLIIYHVAISFQPWGRLIGFPQNETSLNKLWIFMAMINIWRIPILFLISGMGIRFAMERRDWKAMLKDRSVRILLPYLFGIIALEYLSAWIMPKLGWGADYSITFGHLWFLLNIFLYFVWLIGLMVYLKDNPENGFFRFLKRVIKWRYGLFLFALPIMLEAWLVKPQYFSTFVDSLHGWLVGLLYFFMGFLFISLQDVFWPAVKRIRWTALTVALAFYLVRFFVFEFSGMPGWLIAFESMSWILAVLGFASLYLNRPSRQLGYFSRAVYPVYIVHMPVQFVVAYYLFPLQLSAGFKFLFLMFLTFGISLLLYEFFLKRLKWIRPLFGMKLEL